MSAPATIDAEVRVERLVAGGDGLARLPDGRIAFVPGGVPGDLVRIRASGRRDFVRASSMVVLEAGEHRVDAPCPHRRRGCGGCDWQHVGTQLAFKVEVVRESFRRLGRVAHPWIEAGGEVSPWNYRTTMRLAADPRGALGLRGTRSNDVVELPGCPVVHAELGALLSAGLRLDRPGAEVTLRVSSTHPGCTAAIDEGASLLGPSNVIATIDCGLGAALVQRVCSAELRVSARSFFQSGPDAAELLVDQVRRAGAHVLDGRVLDAYGGVGLFAAALGVTDGVLVEGSESAVADARVNVSAGVRVVHGPVESWTPEPVDLVIADPSRRGLDDAAVDVLAATGAERIVLVSSDPAAAARDGARLSARGYVPAGARVLDLFPQTHHVEVVARYDRRHSDESEVW